MDKPLLEINMSFTTSLCLYDGAMTQKVSFNSQLSEMEILCLDTKNLRELTTMIGQNALKVLNFPFNSNNFELSSMSCIIYLRNTNTGDIYGTCHDPHQSLPNIAGSIMVNNMILHPVNIEHEVVASFL